LLLLGVVLRVLTLVEVAVQVVCLVPQGIQLLLVQLLQSQLALEAQVFLVKQLEILVQILFWRAEQP
jgi:hypothetical protein